MIVAPRRGSHKRLGINWRWCIEVATMRDIDDLESGTRGQSRAVFKRIVVASFWTKLFCADKIKADLDAQVKACIPPLDSGEPRPGGATARNLLIRNCLEITRNTGLTATDIYERLSWVEFIALFNHCAWSQNCTHSHYAAQSGKSAITNYPAINASGDETAEIDAEHLESVLNAWQTNPETRH